MRWQVILQALVGVGILFGLAFVAVERHVAPALDDASKARASAEARLAAVEVESAWRASRSALEIAVASLSRSPVISTLAAEFSAEGRERALQDALDGVVQQVGGKGLAAVFDAQGSARAGSASLAATAAVKSAREGASSVRIEVLDGIPYEVVAVPLAGKGAAEGLLAVARPFGKGRLGAWTRGLPLSSVVVLMDGSQTLASLLPPEQLAALRPLRLPPSLNIRGRAHAVAERDLQGGERSGLRVVALAPVGSAQGEALMESLRAGLAVLAVATLLLVMVLSGRVGSAAPNAAVAESAPATAIPEPPLPTPGMISASALSVAEPGKTSAVLPAVRPDALGTYSGVPSTAAETLPPASQDLDATPHSDLETPLPAMPTSPPAGPSATGDLSGPGALFQSASLPPVADLGRPAAAPASTPMSPKPFASRPESSVEFDAHRSSPPPAPPSSQPRGRSEPASFDEIARAAAASARPASPSSSGDENALAPKGGLSPGMIAGQGLASQGPVMVPSHRHEEDLPLPKEQAPQLYDLASTALAPVGPMASADERRASPRGSPGLASASSSSLAPPSSVSTSTPPGSTNPEAQPFDLTHYRRVYEEFVAAKSKLGESVEGLSFDGFGAKLKASETDLIQRHGCRAVRFQVLVKDQAVSLRPQLVR